MRTDKDAGLGLWPERWRIRKWDQEVRLEPQGCELRGAV